MNVIIEIEIMETPSYEPFDCDSFLQTQSKNSEVISQSLSSEYQKIVKQLYEILASLEMEYSQVKSQLYALEEEIQKKDELIKEFRLNFQFGEFQKNKVAQRLCPQCKCRKNQSLMKVSSLKDQQKFAKKIDINQYFTSLLERHSNKAQKDPLNQESDLNISSKNLKVEWGQTPSFKPFSAMKSSRVKQVQLLPNESKQMSNQSTKQNQQRSFDNFLDQGSIIDALYCEQSSMVEVSKMFPSLNQSQFANKTHQSTIPYSIDLTTDLPNLKRQSKYDSPAALKNSDKCSLSQSMYLKGRKPFGCREITNTIGTTRRKPQFSKDTDEEPSFLDLTKRVKCLEEHLCELRNAGSSHSRKQDCPQVEGSTKQQKKEVRFQRKKAPKFPQFSQVPKKRRQC